MPKIILTLGVGFIIVILTSTTIFARCEGDIDNDGDLDGADTVIISADFGRTDCPNARPCKGDIYPTVAPDGKVHQFDLELFASDFGRPDCSIQPPAPINLFNIGDSIGEGIAAYDDLFMSHHETVWSTGYDSDDIVDTMNERFEEIDPHGYEENNPSWDSIFNQAIDGDEMRNFVDQAREVVDAAVESPSGRAGMIALFLGNNDVCTDDVGTMTDPELFESRYRAGLDILEKSGATKNAYIHVTGIPDIYWLWIAKRDNDWCRNFIWQFVPCQELLANADNNCESIESDLDPNTIYANDGPDCVRRKKFHAAIRDDYNRILRDVLQEYKESGRLPNAYYIDIFDIEFGDDHVNSADCFHPSVEGHRVLAEANWCRSPWNRDDTFCGP